MAHFAKLDNDNIVTKIIVVHNNELLDDNNVESEIKGIAFCNSIEEGKWVQTSYNDSFRNVFAGIGFTYDYEFDVFIEPKPFPSWKLNYTTFDWEAPVSKPEPTQGYRLVWSELNQEWAQVALPV
jgi:hypothetical protein